MHDNDIGRHRIPTTSAIILLIAVVGVARVVASVTRNQSVDRASQVAEGSADARFARDMPAHHTPAVEMSMMVRHRASPPDVECRALGGAGTGSMDHADQRQAIVNSETVELAVPQGMLDAREGPAAAP